MKRFVILPERKGKYIIPAIKELFFNSPKGRDGYYCADNGMLFKSLNDGQHIFADEIIAKNKLQELIKDLFE
jgi:hypothetical protein